MNPDSDSARRSERQGDETGSVVPRDTPGDSEALSAAFVDWLKTRVGTSFVEVERWLDGQGVNPKGTYALEDSHNLVLWAGVSTEFCELIKATRSQVELKPLNDFAAFVVYYVDGKMLNLPLAKRPPRNGYKDPHWVPCTLDPASGV